MSIGSNPRPDVERAPPPMLNPARHEPQIDYMSKLIGDWDVKVPASEDATSLLLVLIEMRNRIIQLEKLVGLSA